MLVITREDLDQVFGMENAFTAVSEAAHAWSAGTAAVPPRVALHARHSELEALVMPGTVDDTFAGTKIWYAAGAAATGKLAGSSAVVLLFDPEFGEVLLDGELITDLRTGAMTGLAAQKLATPGASIAAIVGASVQARTQALALLHAIPTLTEIRISSRHRERRLAFASALAGEISQTGYSAIVHPTDTTEEACRGADIIVAATTSRDPVIDDSWVDDGSLVCGVGSHDRESAEIHGDTVARSAIVAVDTRPGGIDGAGDLSRVIAEGRLAREDVLELAQVLTLPALSIDQLARPRVLKTVGFAAADLIAARAATALALEAGLGFELALHRNLRPNTPIDSRRGAE